jgi:sulfite exporter TauE/SafE
MSRLRALDLFDRLVLLGALSGAVGCGLIYPPLALLFLAAVALTLAAVIDRRTPPVIEPEVKP